MSCAAQFTLLAESASLLLVSSTYHHPGRIEQLIDKGNFFVFVVIGVLFYGFLEYQRRQGRSVKVGDKKIN